jgi:hypothetical protein
MQPVHPETQPLYDLMAKARLGTPEAWKEIDAAITADVKAKKKVLFTPVGLAWAMGAGLNDVDDNIRDLAASILEKTDQSEFGVFQADVVRKIRDHIIGDANPYVRFRLAFCLYRRGVRDPLIDKTMDEAAADPDVSDIVRLYRGQ